MPPSRIMNDHWVLAIAVLIFVNVAAAQSSAYLDAHNTARQSVEASIPNLTWDTGLATYATQWAQHQADQDSCKLVHSKGQYGENIYWSSRTSSSTPGNAVQAWFNENRYYDYASNLCQSGHVCGHYTQVVWRNTKRVGCGSSSCSGARSGTFVVCSYDPPGNYKGQSPY